MCGARTPIGASPAPLRLATFESSLCLAVRSCILRGVSAPGKRRPDYPEMPPITMQDIQYLQVAEYILEGVFATEAAANASETG